jgi:hypothetical protein
MASLIGKEEADAAAEAEEGAEEETAAAAGGEPQRLSKSAAYEVTNCW